MAYLEQPMFDENLYSQRFLNFFLLRTKLKLPEINIIQLQHQGNSTPSVSLLNRSFGFGIKELKPG